MKLPHSPSHARRYVVSVIVLSSTAPNLTKADFVKSFLFTDNRNSFLKVQSFLKSSLVYILRQ